MLMPWLTERYKIEDTIDPLTDCYISHEQITAKTITGGNQVDQLAKCPFRAQ